MCNHYRKNPDWRDRMDDWSETRIPVRFDRAAAIPNTAAEVYPAGVGEIVMPAEEDRLVAAAASWIFMPWKPGLTWAEWSKTRRGCNNARGEEADTKWPFGPQSKRGRCLIPGDAFYEWDDGPKGGKTEYRFAYPDGRPFFFAGLCNRVEPPDAGPMLTYAMITKAAGGDTAAIGHPRQPVILEAAELDAWLDPANPIASFTTRVDPAGTFTLEPVKGPKALAGA
ncbi:MAG TPA: SOS response-associated peptidase family protein [Phenylobacterium sp.]|nr:SOS response-associated peptidase family protein [Phenylobacterium sp.]